MKRDAKAVNIWGSAGSAGSFYMTIELLFLIEMIFISHSKSMEIRKEKRVD